MLNLKKIGLMGLVTVFLLVSSFFVVYGAEKLIKSGNGFLEVRDDGLRVLHLKGNAYERGYQRGMLLGDAYTEEVSTDITWYSLVIGGGDFEAGHDAILWAKDMMEPFVPYQFRHKIQGMADALATQGSPITYEDIIQIPIADDLFMTEPDPNKDLTTPGKRLTYPSLRCSSFVAYGDATKDGSLITAGNQDYFNTEEVIKNRVVVVVDPTDGGYGYTAATWSFFEVLGMNETGISIVGQLSPSEPETLVAVPTEFLLNMVLQYSDSIDDAVDLLTMYPRSVGIILTIADAKTNEAAVIEWTADELTVRRPEPGKNVIWSTNHFNCYPGWQGYTGYNIVPSNAKRLKLSDVSTVEKWQDSLATVGRGRASRYGRLEQLLNDNYGEISLEKAQEIISDRYSMKQGRVVPPTETTAPGDYPISAYFDDWVVSDATTYYKSDKSGELRLKDGNVWSYVAVPVTGDIWWAIGLPPAQYGGYKHLNLYEELERNR